MSSVAIVGGGPAGKAAARELRQADLGVTIFEKEATTGGLMRHGYPPYRMPDAISERDEARLADLGIELKPGHTLGQNLSLDQLEQSYDAVILTVGAPVPKTLGIPGEDLHGVWAALEFLHLVRKDQAPEIGPEVVVLGGGDTAFDAATTTIKLGAGKVILHYRGDREGLRALAHERKRAAEAGVRMDFRRSPQKITRNERLEVHYPDRAEAYDTVIVAVGQDRDDRLFKKLGITLGADVSTNRPKVFVAGGTRYGSDRLANAILDGRRAAEAVLTLLHKSS